eukprot:gnl/TRDRNA2_/TRDRNA2_144559_c1_seq3.p1 gnl/TRDRNA2_/TRDRNA2_144559_c1~~gnl/TRDRNA2_/TRDRNA2_144559_c1_seq3.p1  ORF type:complete len:320 (-),score=-12.32 gnl/TRDRNA2_/TRDRNA2_144559_c1_seq3:295-1167(-)
MSGADSSMLMRDPVMASWATIFSNKFRSQLKLLGMLGSSDGPRRIVLASHHRQPPWWWNFPWEDTLYDSVCVAKTTMHKYTILEQLRIISGAVGIMSVQGSALAHQLWLPRMSMVYVMANPVCRPNRECNCTDPVRRWDDCSGLHLGHTVFLWRFCGDSDEFVRSRPRDTVRFLVRKNHEARKQRIGWTCIMYSPPANISHISNASGSWPMCHQIVSLPVGEPYRQCGCFGDVGLPYLSRNVTGEWLVTRANGWQRKYVKRGSAAKGKSVRPVPFHGDRGKVLYRADPDT